MPSPQLPSANISSDPLDTTTQLSETIQNISSIQSLVQDEQNSELSFADQSYPLDKEEGLTSGLGLIIEQETLEGVAIQVSLPDTEEANISTETIGHFDSEDLQEEEAAIIDMSGTITWQEHWHDITDELDHASLDNLGKGRQTTLKQPQQVSPFSQQAHTVVQIVSDVKKSSSIERDSDSKFSVRRHSQTTICSPEKSAPRVRMLLEEWRQGLSKAFSRAWSEATESTNARSMSEVSEYPVHNNSSGSIKCSFPVFTPTRAPGDLSIHIASQRMHRAQRQRAQTGGVGFHLPTRIGNPMFASDLCSSPERLNQKTSDASTKLSGPLDPTRHISRQSDDSCISGREWSNPPSFTCQKLFQTELLEKPVGVYSIVVRDELHQKESKYKTYSDGEREIDAIDQLNSLHTQAKDSWQSSRGSSNESVEVFESVEAILSQPSYSVSLSDPMDQHQESSNETAGEEEEEYDDDDYTFEAISSTATSFSIQSRGQVAPSEKGSADEGSQEHSCVPSSRQPPENNIRSSIYSQKSKRSLLSSSTSSTSASLGSFDFDIIPESDNAEEEVENDDDDDDDERASHRASSSSCCDQSTTSSDSSAWNITSFPDIPTFHRSLLFQSSNANDDKITVKTSSTSPLHRAQRVTALIEENSHLPFYSPTEDVLALYQGVDDTSKECEDEDDNGA